MWLLLGEHVEHPALRSNRKSPVGTADGEILPSAHRVLTFSKKLSSLARLERTVPRRSSSSSAPHIPMLRDRYFRAP